MLYDSHHSDTTARERENNLHAQFYSLLYQGRYDRAIAFRTEHEGEIGEEVFELSWVREAGLEAMILAVRIGNVEDPMRLMEAFRLSDDVLEHSRLLDALRHKFHAYNAWGHPDLERLQSLYPNIDTSPFEDTRA